MSSGRPIATAPLPFPSPLAGAAKDPKAADPKSGENPKKCSRCQARYPVDFLLCPRDGTPLELEGAANADPMLGKVLDSSYQIVRLVGEGGMGRVYEARHLRLKDRRLAVKVLHPEFARDAEIVARFQREAESSSLISHPNVVDVYDVSKTPDGTPYMLAELLTGEELAKRIERQVWRARGAAHSRQVVHRDMKPENVFLLEQDGGVTVKVIDFGISKVAETGANLTKTGMVMGTPSYMAPEQARGDKVDTRADIYAVGAMLYHALTGKKPFDTDDPASTLTLVLTEEPERPRALNDKVPEGLELIVQKAMAKDPRDRYQTMPDLDLALAPFESIPIFDPRPSGSHTLVRRDGGGVAVAPSEQSGDPNARTMIASVPGMSSGSMPTMLTASGEAAKYARPTVVMSLLFLIAALLAGLLDGIGGFVRFMHGGDRLSNAEIVLTVLGVLAASATPIILYISRISKVWKNSVKTLEIATDLRRALISSMLAYGAGALGVRLTWMIILQEPSKLESGLIDAGLFIGALVVGLLAGVVGPLVRAWRKPKT